MKPLISNRIESIFAVCAGLFPTLFLFIHFLCYLFAWNSFLFIPVSWLDSISAASIIFFLSMLYLTKKIPNKKINHSNSKIIKSDFSIAELPYSDFVDLFPDNLISKTPRSFRLIAKLGRVSDNRDFFYRYLSGLVILPILITFISFLEFGYVSWFIIYFIAGIDFLFLIITLFGFYQYFLSKRFFTNAELVRGRIISVETNETKENLKIITIEFEFLKSKYRKFFECEKELCTGLSNQIGVMFLSSDASACCILNKNTYYELYDFAKVNVETEKQAYLQFP